jgi:long-chain acyl-CoA synthetase
MNYPNIYALFNERVNRYAERDVFFVRRDNAWHGIKWQAFGDEARDFGCALIRSGLTQGAAVCILMSNVPEWPVSDIGTIIAGGVGVGLYPTSSAEQCRYIINHSDAEFVLVDTLAQLEKILRVRDQLPKVKAVIALDETIASDGVMSYKNFLELGRQRRDAVLPVLEDRARNARPTDVAIMVYTSGTTGEPKGACLSHAYVINSVESLRATIPLDERDVAFSYLPYCHVAERISGLYNRLYTGMSAYFVDDPAKLWAYLLDVKPTIFPSLPRFFEKVHARVFADLQNASDEDQQRFQQALQVGRHLSRLRQANEPVPDELRRGYEQQALPVLNRVKDYFGGRLRIATSGGAPLPVEIAEFFDACGLPILQAYGLTENVCVAFNRPNHHRFGTVGPPMPGCEIRIATDDEILIRSEMMFSGYYKEPQKTAEMFRDGWLLTGDLGEIDADGFLKITGRKKELIITSTGKNVAPQLIENLLKEHPLMSQAMAYGDGKSYLVALITLNQAETESYARAHGIAHDSFAALTRAEEIVALVRRIVAGVNARLSSTEAIKRFVVLDHDLSIEADEVTPTMKIKRNIVSARYKDLLEALYR